MGGICWSKHTAAPSPLLESLAPPEGSPQRTDDELWHGGPPVAAYKPPGSCVFGADWAAAPLLSKQKVSSDTLVLTFGLSDISKPLGLSTCACLLVRGPNGKVKPYTPISTNAMLGRFELLIKVYNTPAALSRYLGHELKVGEQVSFKHIPVNVKIQYPFKAAHIGMIAGGTGINPMIQALHVLLGTPGDTTRVTLLLSNKQEGDILARGMLDRWADLHGDRFEVLYTLTRSPKDSGWTGQRGRIGRELITKHMPSPSAKDTLIFLCGPPGMYNDLAGARGVPDISGVMADIGYSTDQVVKF